MQDITQSRIASVLTTGVGVWLLVSPLFISVTGNALINLLVVGGVVTVAGLVQLIWENTIPSWINALAAVWLFIAAFMFSGISTTVAWNEAISAAVAFLLATWDGIEIDQVHREHHART
jgi:hypothetical protein